MKGGKGGALLAFLGKPKGPAEEGEEPESDDMGDDMGSVKMSAAEDAIAALKSGDATALSDALTRHYDACSGMGSPMADSEEEEIDEEY